MEKNKQPKIKADGFVEFEGSEEPTKFTNFEELIKRVEVLQDAVNEHAEILRYNHIVRTEKVEAPYFDDDEVYKKLEAEDED